MKVYIELLIPLLIVLIAGLWFLWFKLSKKFHNWRYKPENDRGKKGEEHRQELIKAGQPDPIGAITDAVKDTGGQGKPEGQDIVQATELDIVRKDSNGFGKGSKSGRKFRNPFKKR